LPIATTAGNKASATGQRQTRGQATPQDASQNQHQLRRYLPLRRKKRAPETVAPSDTSMSVRRRERHQYAGAWEESCDAHDDSHARYARHLTSRASPKRRCMSRTERLREVAPARTMPRAPLVLARLAWPSRPRSSARWRHEQGCVQMGRYWEVEADHEGPVPCTVPVRAGCGASGRRERATRVGSANGRREWAARAGGASGRCSRVARKRSFADGAVLGRFRTQAPLGLLGGWGVAPRPRLGA